MPFKKLVPHAKKQVKINENGRPLNFAKIRHCKNRNFCNIARWVEFNCT